MNVFISYRRRHGDHYEIEDAWALNLQGRAEIVSLVKAPLLKQLEKILK